MRPTPSSAGPDVVTLGCRLNAYESEVMKAHAASAGLDDAVIINTCAVTGEAVRQAAQTIRRLKRDRPGVRIIVTGCAAQLQPDRFAALPEVDHVVGNAEKMKAATFVEIARQSREADADVRVSDIMQVRQSALHLLDGFGTRARAQVEVQNGCDHRCTFCIIPFARGHSRSAGIDQIVDQVRRHAEQGYNEVVLTGVDMTSYGADLPGQPALGALVRRILRDVPELPRLRLSSIDQVEADEELIRAIADEPRLMPHLHLSLQSGDDLILKRMKRRHQRSDAISFCEKVRRLRPDIVFGADIIAGFPTETEEMFGNSLNLIDACGITYVHAFPYSPRPGTPAARMPQTGRQTAKARAARLRERGDEVLSRYLASLVGRQVTILVEAKDMGRTPQYAEVRFDPTDIRDGGSHGSLMRVRILGMAETGSNAARQLMGVPT